MRSKKWSLHESALILSILSSHVWSYIDDMGFLKNGSPYSWMTFPDGTATNWGLNHTCSITPKWKLLIFMAANYIMIPLQSNHNPITIIFPFYPMLYLSGSIRRYLLEPSARLFLCHHHPQGGSSWLPPERFPIQKWPGNCVPCLEHSLYNVTTWYTSHAFLWEITYRTWHTKIILIDWFTYHNWWFSMAFYGYVFHQQRVAFVPSPLLGRKRIRRSAERQGAHQEVLGIRLDFLGLPGDENTLLGQEKSYSRNINITPKRGCFTSSSGISI